MSRDVMRRLAAAACACAATVILAADLPTRPVPLENGSEFQGAEVRALQADDFANPMSLWVSRGEAVWNEARGSDGKSCASCHGEATRSMKGVTARYPRWDASLGRVVNVEERIQACSEQSQGAGRFSDQSDELVGLSAYIALQSRGLPMSVSISGPAQATFEKGRSLYFMRMGQMNLAC